MTGPTRFALLHLLAAVAAHQGRHAPSAAETDARSDRAAEDLSHALELLDTLDGESRFAAGTWLITAMRGLRRPESAGESRAGDGR